MISFLIVIEPESANPSSPLESSEPTKRRRALTDLNRRNIRRRNSQYPGLQIGLISWFQEGTGRTLTQGQISGILSEKSSNSSIQN